MLNNMKYKSVTTNTFNSLEEFINAIEKFDYSKAEFTRSSMKEGDVETEFRGSTSLSHAYEICRKGIQTGSVAQKVNNLSRHIERKREVEVMSVAGAYVDIGSYLGGEPECMVTYESQEQIKYVDVVVSLSENCMVTEDTFIKKGTIAALLVDSLEASGYRVTLKLMTNNLSHDHGDVMINIITIKQANQQMSIGQMMGCMTPAFLRRIEFAHIEKWALTHRKGKIPVGYGRAVLDKELLMDAISKDGTPIVIGATDGTIGLPWWRHGTIEIDYVNQIIKNYEEDSNA
jgi:hypothetical protein